MKQLTKSSRKWRKDKVARTVVARHSRLPKFKRWREFWAELRDFTSLCWGLRKRKSKQDASGKKIPLKFCQKLFDRSTNLDTLDRRANFYRLCDTMSDEEANLPSAKECQKRVEQVCSNVLYYLGTLPYGQDCFLASLSSKLPKFSIRPKFRKSGRISQISLDWLCRSASAM